MRLSAIAAEEGCWNDTDSPPPMLKLFQSSTAWEELCVTLTLFTPPAIDADPAETCPPAGKAYTDTVSRPC